MRSRLLSVKVPHPLVDAMRELCKEEGYGSLHECIIGTMIEKVLVHRRRRWVRDLANSRPKIQDYLLDKLLEFPMDMDATVEFFRQADGGAVRR